jgi:hypothetical protein
VLVARSKVDISRATCRRALPTRPTFLRPSNAAGQIRSCVAGGCRQRYLDGDTVLSALGESLPHRLTHDAEAFRPAGDRARPSGVCDGRPWHDRAGKSPLPPFGIARPVGSPQVGTQQPLRQADEPQGRRYGLSSSHFTSMACDEGPVKRLLVRPAQNGPAAMGSRQNESFAPTGLATWICHCVILAGTDSPKARTRQHVSRP